jgi:hypothetical protein
MFPKYFESRFYILWKVGKGFVRIEKETRTISASLDGYVWQASPIEEAVTCSPIL